MKPENFPPEIKSRLLPQPGGKIIYRCLSCGNEFGIKKLLYTCPKCGQVLLLHDLLSDRLKDTPPQVWRDLFDYRKMANIPAISGIYLYHEFLGSIMPADCVVYLGEGHTPLVEASPKLQEHAGMRFFYKNDGQNPSASFKDRGMASAISYINYLIKAGHVKDVLAICASTGDTSASAALYASYLHPAIKSAVLLPHKKVTPQQLGQPLGAGAAVFEIPGVFDDCMKVVEALSEKYNVALLNSKNAWRILGQESYSYEISQDFDYDVSGKAIVVPIGNAGNITAIMSGFLKFYETGIIQSLPKIIGVQSHHADPVYRYYLEPVEARRRFEPVTVKPSVAQAAMIGNPVSMPRVISLVKKYNGFSGKKNVFVVQVTEQQIMDSQLVANRHGHVACTQGGECLAGLMAALQQNIVDKTETGVLDSTAHALKFSGFQEMYFENSFPPQFGVQPKNGLRNCPVLVCPAELEKTPAYGKPLKRDEFESFVEKISEDIAKKLGLAKRS